MSRWLSPKAWYLVGIGATALAIDGARRLIRRRRSAARAGDATPGVEAPAVNVTPPVATPRAAPAQPAAADDLTAIKGIGPTYAGRLRAAGITTFAALAAASPDYLRQVARAPAVADPQTWIDQARARLENL